MIHVRYEGRSYDLALKNLRANASDREIKDAVAREMDIAARELYNYVVDRRPNGQLIVRPEAVYG